MKEANANTTTRNEPDTWKPLSTASAPLLRKLLVKSCGSAAATAVLSGLYEKQNEEGADDRRRCDAQKKRDEEQRAYVEQRLKDLAEFERRARGRPK